MGFGKVGSKIPRSASAVVRGADWGAFPRSPDHFSVVSRQAVGRPRRSLASQGCPGPGSVVVHSDSVYCSGSPARRSCRAGAALPGWGSQSNRSAVVPVRARRVQGQLREGVLDHGAHRVLVGPVAGVVPRGDGVGAAPSACSGKSSPASRPRMTSSRARIGPVALSTRSTPHAAVLGHELVGGLLERADLGRDRGPLGVGLGEVLGELGGAARVAEAFAHRLVDGGLGGSRVDVVPPAPGPVRGPRAPVLPTLSAIGVRGHGGAGACPSSSIHTGRTR